MQITLPRKKQFVFQKSRRTIDPLEDTAFGPYYEDAAWGVRIVTRDIPRAWVKDCRTGQPLPKEQARLVGRGKDGKYYWIKIGEKTYLGEKSYASTWSEGEIP